MTGQSRQTGYVFLGSFGTDCGARWRATSNSLGSQDGTGGLASLEADLVELYTAMNDWHIARGGSGLSVGDFKKYIAAGVLPPVAGG